MHAPGLGVGCYPTAGAGGQNRTKTKGETVKILKSAALIAAGFLALTGCQKGAVDTSADEAAIRAATTTWVNAYNAGDAAAMGANYAEDAVLLPPNAPAVSGRAAIGEYLGTDSAGTRAAGLKFNIPGDGPVGVSSDLAYESGSFSVTDAAGATVATGKYIGVFNKIDGKWLLVRDTWNTDAPPTPAPAAEPAAEAPTT
jgi:ketosteroid isomerase-like protein